MVDRAAQARENTCTCKLRFLANGSSDVCIPEFLNMIAKLPKIVREELAKSSFFRRGGKLFKHKLLESKSKDLFIRGMGECM